jgi:hypothetical protein
MAFLVFGSREHDALGFWEQGAWHCHGRFWGAGSMVWCHFSFWEQGSMSIIVFGSGEHGPPPLYQPQAISGEPFDLQSSYFACLISINPLHRLFIYMYLSQWFLNLPSHS